MPEKKTQKKLTIAFKNLHATSFSVVKIHVTCHEVYLMAWDKFGMWLIVFLFHCYLYFIIENIVLGGGIFESMYLKRCFFFPLALVGCFF